MISTGIATPYLLPFGKGFGFAARGRADLRGFVVVIEDVHVSFFLIGRGESLLGQWLA